MIRRSTVVCLMLLMLGLASASAQIMPQRGYRSLPLGKDTLCFRYHFVPGDSLLYKVEAIDSITFGKQESYAKQRFEWVTLICDSVSSVGHYYLRYQVLASREITIAYPQMDTALRETSPWKDRTAYLVVDSLERRIRT